MGYAVDVAFEFVPISLSFSIFLIMPIITKFSDERMQLPWGK